MNASLRCRVQRLHVGTLLAGCLALGVTACGGGGGGSTPVQTVPAPGTSPTTTPTGAPTATPVPASTVTLSVPAVAFNGTAQTASFTAVSSTASALSAIVDKPAVAS